MADRAKATEGTVIRAGFTCKKLLALDARTLVLSREELEIQ